MTYVITYQKKGADKEKEWNIGEDRSVVIEAITQLGKGFCSFDGDIINGIVALEKIQISEQNYDEENGGEYIMWQETTMEERREHGLQDKQPFLLGVHDNFIPFKEDITNKIFLECHITSDSFDKNNLLEGDILTIRNEQFPLKSGSKIKDIFSILMKLKMMNNSLEVSYEDMLELFERGGYESLRKSDINETCIRDLIKKKIPVITKKLHLDTPYLKITTSTITFQF